MTTNLHRLLALSTVPLLALAAVSEGCASDPADDARRAYIPNAGDGTVSVIDMDELVVLDTHVVSEGEEAATSHGIAISAAGDRLFVGDAAAGELKVIDTESFEVLDSVSLGIQVHGIDIGRDGRRLVVSGSRLPDRDHKYSYVVDTESLEAVELDTNTSGHGDATTDGRYVYINDIIGHRIVVIDLDERSIATEILVGPETWEDEAVGPNEVVFAPDGRTAYTADYGGQSVTILDTSDPRAPRPVGSIPVTELPHGIDVTPDGSEIWLSNRASQDVAVISAETQEELARVSTAPYTANHVSLTPDGRRAYVTLTAPATMTDQTGYVLVLDVETRAEIARMAVGRMPHELSFED